MSSSATKVNIPLVAQFGGPGHSFADQQQLHQSDEINLNYSDDDNPLSLKSVSFCRLCELIVGGRDGLQPIENGD